MSYYTYQTEGLVLDDFDVGENNRILLVFSKELGLIRAYAKSSRSERSKLRPLFQKFSCINFSIVQGRNTLRITGADGGYNLFYELFGDYLSEGKRSENRLKIESISRVYTLLVRLLQGQEKDYKLYNTIRTFTDYLKKDYNDKESARSLELLTVSRILYNLGYMEDQKEMKEIISSWDINPAMVRFFDKNYKKILKKVNEAIENSQL